MVCKFEKSEKTETRAQTESLAAKLGLHKTLPGAHSLGERPKARGAAWLKLFMY